jgi:hypothetical protein
VLGRGPLAVVWTPREVRVDGKRRPCGIDVFDLAEVNGDWLMTGGPSGPWSRVMAMTWRATGTRRHRSVAAADVHH